MLRAIMLDVPVGKIRRLMRFKAVRIAFLVLALVSLCLAIWFGFVMTGIPWLVTVWTRAAAIGLILGVIGLVAFLRWRRRRRAAEALEDSLMQGRVGDGDVLADRMNQALDKLKRSGGKTYLYDLPWYVIIGPPGAGKTTALRYSGIEFPGQDLLTDQGHGFGGTRNCDWWFAEDAVLIDTAGRYTTQDSDAEADRASWTAFLTLLKKGRPDQPINGVILAFSVEELMTASPESLAAHAATVRERLGEIHETLKVDFPVYVLFTKADLIAGFREYFASFSRLRRNGVWGVTFQTRDRKAETHKSVATEFDALVSRLSDEVVDRMSEEQDDVNRIAIFGLPGQMGLLRDNLAAFLRRVFEPTRYESNAILRGFYFSSGTQEGTPFDQVLGAMARAGGEGEAQQAFMSGKGKSFFLHDLLTKVIFAERDWVNHDAGAVRRSAILRTMGITVVGLAAVLAMGAFGYSFWQNASLVRQAEAHAATYINTAAEELNRSELVSADPTDVLPHLDALRDMPGGFGTDIEPSVWTGFGLSQRAQTEVVAREAYSDGLERLLRPRMLLHLENRLPQMIVNGDSAAVFRALKVYMLLGGEGEGEGDDVIASYFDAVWRDLLPGARRFEDRESLSDHVRAMLALDGEQRLAITIDQGIKNRARESIVNLSVAEQAYAGIQERAALQTIADFNLYDHGGEPVRLVFRTTNGSPIEEVGVDRLYTFEGFWGYFVDEVETARQQLEQDEWVLGDTGDRVNYDQQLANLPNDLFRMYRADFKTAWDDMFALLTVASMSQDDTFQALTAASSNVNNSPFFKLAEAVDLNTRMTRIYDEIAAMDPEALGRAAASGDLGSAMGSAMFSRIYSRSGVFSRVLLDQASARSKNESRPGGLALSQDTDRQRAQRIETDFVLWHQLVEGAADRRPIDQVIAGLDMVQDTLRTAQFQPTPADDQLLAEALAQLTRTTAALPEPMARMINAVATEFRNVAENATLSELNRLLNNEVTQFCRTEIKPYFPFAENARHVSPSIFGQFFGPGGRMDRFMSQHLQPHVIQSASGLEPNPRSRIGERLSPAFLASFNQAAQIRRAFFPTGTPSPEVQMSVTHQSSTSGRDGVAFSMLTIHGKTVQTQPNSTPAAFSWPGQTAGVSIEMVPDINRNSTVSFNQGRWDIVRFLEAGLRDVRGNAVTLTFNRAGRFITYRVQFDTPRVPFLLPELKDFACPVTLE